MAIKNFPGLRVEPAQGGTTSFGNGDGVAYDVYIGDTLIKTVRAATDATAEGNIKKIADSADILREGWFNKFDQLRFLSGDPSALKAVGNRTPLRSMPTTLNKIKDALQVETVNKLVEKQKAEDQAKLAELGDYAGRVETNAEFYADHPSKDRMTTLTENADGTFRVPGGGTYSSRTAAEIALQAFLEAPSENFSSIKTQQSAATNLPDLYTPPEETPEYIEERNAAIQSFRDVQDLRDYGGGPKSNELLKKELLTLASANTQAWNTDLLKDQVFLNALVDMGVSKIYKGGMSASTGAPRFQSIRIDNIPNAKDAQGNPLLRAVVSGGVNGVSWNDIIADRGSANADELANIFWNPTAAAFGQDIEYDPSLIIGQIEKYGDLTSSSARLGKPSASQFAQLTGVSMSQAIDALRTILLEDGSDFSPEVDTRDWGAILQAEDPYAAAMAAKRALEQKYTDRSLESDKNVVRVMPDGSITSNTSGTNKQRGYEKVAHAGNWIVVDSISAGAPSASERTNAGTPKPSLPYTQLGYVNPKTGYVTFISSSSPESMFKDIDRRGFGTEGLAEVLQQIKPMQIPKNDPSLFAGYEQQPGRPPNTSKPLYISGGINGKINEIENFLAQYGEIASVGSDIEDPSIYIKDMPPALEELILNHRNYSSEEKRKILHDTQFLNAVDPNTGEVRNVTIPKGGYGVETIEALSEQGIFPPLTSDQRDRIAADIGSRATSTDADEGTQADTSGQDTTALDQQTEDLLSGNVFDTPGTSTGTPSTGTPSTGTPSTPTGPTYGQQQPATPPATDAGSQPTTTTPPTTDTGSQPITTTPPATDTGSQPVTTPAGQPPMVSAAGTTTAGLQTAGLSAVPYYQQQAPQGQAGYSTQQLSMTTPGANTANTGSTNVQYSNNLGQTITVTEVNGQPTTNVPPGYTKKAGFAEGGMSSSDTMLEAKYRIATMNGYNGPKTNAALDTFANASEGMKRKFNAIGTVMANKGGYMTKGYAVGGMTTGDLAQMQASAVQQTMQPTQAPVSMIQASAPDFIPTQAGQVAPTAPMAEAATVGTVQQAAMPAMTPAASMVPTAVTPAVQQETAQLQAAQGTVAPQAQVTAQTQADTSVSNLQAAQGQAIMMDNPVQREIQAGELITGAADAQKAAQFTEQVQAATATPSVQATVQGQLEGLMQQFENGETPAWAAGSMRAAMATLSARGLGASSMAGQAVIQATMEAALPIAQIDAQTQAQFEAQNLSNRQQRAMLSAQQRAQFLGQEFDQAFQARVQNSARIGDIANMNFTAEQNIALENSRAANTMNLNNLSNRQAMVMAEAAALSNLDMANLNNRQQAAVQNAQNFLQMDMQNLSNEQQAAMFKSQQNIQALFTDQAATNAAAQFNASSENQTNQFFANMANQTSQFNASQQNAMDQFNVNSVNALREFNAEVQQQRDMFNAQNGLVIAQANAQWRQNIATMNTAAQNESNAEFAKTMNALTSSNMNQIWQRERDIMSFTFAASESAADRNAQIALAKLTADEAAQLQDNIGKGKLIATAADKLLDKWLS